MTNEKARVFAKRTEVDYSNHELHIVENEHVKIHHLKKPGTSVNSVKFINSGGVLAVTGDFGNWIFCKEFIPDASNEGVSNGYWEEKLRIASCQQPYDFDSEGTASAIQELKKEHEWNQDIIEFLDLMEENAFMMNNADEFAFTAMAECPRGFELEDLPIVKKRKFWLSAVFDAFERCCEILIEKGWAVKKEVGNAG